MTWIKILWIFWKNKQKILRKVEKSEKSISCKENFSEAQFSFILGLKKKTMIFLSIFVKIS